MAAGWAALAVAGLVAGCSTTSHVTAPAARSADPQAVPGPGVSVAFFDHGVGVVGFGPAHGEAASLWLSTNGATWRDVTPAQLAATPAVWVESASFLDARHGWVVAWDPDTIDGHVYATDDGGRRWRPIKPVTHNASAGSHTIVQLVSSQVGTVSTIEPNGPTMQLEITTDGGRTWRPTLQFDDGLPPPRPFETAFSFVSATHGFAASGLPPLEPGSNPGPATLLATDDAGRHWAKVLVPLPRAASSCTHDRGAVCLLDLPQLDPRGDGAVASEVLDQLQATVGFDVTSDGGRQWRLVSALQVRLPRQHRALDGGPPQDYALTSIAGPRSWWVVARSTQGLTTWTSESAGASWRSRSATGPADVPLSLYATGRSTAWLLVSGPFGAGTHRLYRTTDAGRSWISVDPTSGSRHPYG